MDTESFLSEFKEQLNIEYENSATKRDKFADSYQAGIANGIDITERIFDRLWKKYDKED